MELKAIKVDGLLRVVGHAFELKKFFESDSFSVSNSPTRLRSVLQNNSFHGDCKIISEVSGYTQAQVKIILKDQFAEYFPVSELINPLNGVIHYIQKGTSDLSTKQFSEFQEEYRAWFELQTNAEIKWYVNKEF